MTPGKRNFSIGIAFLLVCIIITGCLPNKQGGFSCVCAPLISKAQSFITKIKAPASTDSPASAGPTRPHPPVRTGTITTGPKTQLASQSIGSSGGQVVVTKAGDALNSFVVDVPSGAYSGSTAFTVSSSPITRQTFGEDINPITPMITVDNGGGFADEIMFVRVPVKVPEDHFAMGFIYDEKSKQLEGMPMVGKDNESITLATCHFSNFFISMIEDAVLQKGVDSGFRPGIDDWQFENQGSYIAPNGHCAGQSMAAMWYYYATPDGKDACLFNRYDNNGNQPATPELWEDDSLGYRLCSVVQKDYAGQDVNIQDKWHALAGIGWVKENNKWKRISVPGIGDDNTRRLFAYAIRASKLPQYVGIRGQGGHAIVCYAVSENGTLSVADPNYPGVSGMCIVFDVAGKKYQPYSSAANAADIKAGKGSLYDKIIYTGAWTLVPYDKLAQRWQQLKAGTIGKGIFPAYVINYKDQEGNWNELKDGYVSPTSNLVNNVTFGGNPLAQWGTFRDGVAIRPVTLKPGNNLLGYSILGKVNNTGEYVDFKYINVVYSSLAIEPSPLDGEANKEYTFTAKPAAAVSKPRYEWAVDGAAQQAKGAQLNYTFKKEGAYSVTCKLYDDSTADKKLVGEAEAKATISAQQGNTPPFVRDCKYLSFVLNPKANCVHDQYKDDASKQNYDTMKPTKSVVFQKNIPITWSGVNFSGKYKGAPASVRYKMGNSSDFTLDCSFNGWVSPDGKTIRQLNMTMVYTRKDNAYVETWKYEFKDLPFTNTIEAEGNLIREFTVFSSNNPAAHGKFTATYKGPPESYGSLSGSEKMSSGTGTCLNGMWENYTIKGVGPIRFGLKVNTAELNGL